MVVRDATDAFPLWLFVVAVIVMWTRVGVILHEKFYPPDVPQRIKWLAYDDVKKRFFEMKKPAAVFFVHEGKCLLCKDLESTLEQPDIAELIQKNYIPVKIVYPHRVAKDELPKELERLKDNLGVWSVPKLVLVTPEVWDVPLESDAYYLPKIGGETLGPRDSATMKKLINESVDWHPEVLEYGQVDWVKPDIALKQASDTKPALLFFGRSLDRHSDYVRSKIFGDKELNKAINEKFLPAFVVSFERKNIPDSEETKALLKRFRIKAFPTIVVSSPSRPSQVLTGYPGSAETMEFLKQTLEK